MSPTFSRAVLGALALTASLIAQRTWIVDPAGSSGFRDLPPALIAATDGDVIILRGVTPPFDGYTTATTNKGVTILGEPGARFSGSNFAPLTVAGLPTGRAFVLAGVEFPLPPYGFSFQCLRLAGCLGPVHIERAVLTSRSIAVHVTDCTQVTLSNTSISSPGAGLHIESGSPDVALVDCTVSSNNGPCISVTNAPPLAPRILVSGGAIVSLSGPAVNYQPNVRPGPSTLTIAGGRATTVLGTGSLAIIWDGPLTVDPTAQIIGAIQSAQQPVMQRMPALSALGAPPGQPIRTNIRSPAGEAAVLLASVPTQRTPTAPFGDLWIDPALIFFVAGGIQGAGEQLDIVIPTPASAPRGLVLGLQALAGPGINLQLSNPSVVVIN